MADRLTKIFRPVLPPHPPTSADRKVVLLMWAAGVVQGYAAAHAVNTLPFARLTLGLTEGQMAGLLSVSRIGALLALLFSIWGDARTRRVPYLTAFALLIVGAAVTGMSNGPATYALAQIAVRLGATAAAILGAIILIETVSTGLRAYALSIYAAATSLGAGLATIAVAIAGLGAENWRWVFASSIAGLGLLPPLVRHLRPRVHEPGAPRSWWRHLASDQRRWFGLMAAVSYCLAVFSAVAVSFAFERLIDDLGLSGVEAAAVALSGGTLGGVGFLVGGRLADTWGRKNTTLVAMAFALVGSLGIYHLSAPLAVAASFFVSSSGSFMLTPALGTLRNELFPPDVRSRAVAWINNLAVMGSVTGLTIGQVTIDTYGLTTTVTWLAGGVLIAFILVPWLPETRPDPAGITMVTPLA